MLVLRCAAAWGLALLAAGGLTACGRTSAATRAVIAIDGSSTVYPLTEAVAEDFQRLHPGTRITVGVAGTGGGLRRLCRGALDIANASRPITAAEASVCAAAGIAFVEVPVAYDGITVAVNPANTWVDHLGLDELRRLWRHEAEGRLVRWSQLRPTFPDREIHLFGPGVESGTFDYFTGVVTGVPRDSRGDYTSSEDDNMLVQGVAGDTEALGFFGYAYYEEHRELLRAVPIRAAAGLPAVLPTRESIRSGTYHPLSRPVFIYVSARSLARPDVRALLEYYTTHLGDLADDVGYVPLEDRVRIAVRARLASGTQGSLFLPPTRLARTPTLAARLGLE